MYMLNTPFISLRLKFGTSVQKCEIRQYDCCHCFHHGDDPGDDAGVVSAADGDFLCFAADIYRVLLHGNRWCRFDGDGEINPKGLEFYNKLVDELIANGIEPMVTLYHWDLPSALQDKGGWLNRDIVKTFGRYASIIAKEFKGRVIAPGTVKAEAVVSHGGFNTLASLQGALQFGDKKATCGDQNNPDLHGKELAGKALCLPQTIGSTTGGLVIYCACAMQRQPACMLFSNPIDSLAAAGSILASVWLPDVKMPVIDSLGEEFLNYVQHGMTITVQEDGTVCVE